MTPNDLLMKGVLTGNFHKVKTALKKGATNLKCSTSMAVFKNRLKIVKYLLEYDQELVERALRDSIRSKQNSITNYILSNYQVDPNFGLRTAIYVDDVSLVNLFLNNGAVCSNENITHAFGNALIYYYYDQEIRYDSLEITYQLFKSGCSINDVNLEEIYLDTDLHNDITFDQLIDIFKKMSSIYKKYVLEREYTSQARDRVSRSLEKQHVPDVVESVPMDIFPDFPHMLMDYI